MIKEFEVWRGHVISICKSDGYICIDATDTNSQRVTFELDIDKLSLETQNDLSMGCDFETKVVVFNDDTSKVLFRINPPYIWTKEDVEKAQKLAERYTSFFDKEKNS